jgi:hypothetical protein
MSADTLRILNPALDDKNLAILAERAAAYLTIQGPRVGDYVKMPDGTLRRFTHDWGDKIQTTVGARHPCDGDASFYLCCPGASFSGSLDPSISKAAIRDTGEKLPGAFWFFRDNYVTAHNGVGVRMPCTVWAYEPKASA